MSIIADALGSLASGVMNAMAAIAVKVAVYTVIFDIFFSLFHLILEIIVLLVILIYVISIASLFFNIPYLLFNHTSGSLLPIDASQINSLGNGSDAEKAIHNTANSILSNDIQLDTFNSIFGWSLLGGGLAFVFCLLVFIFIRAIVFTIGRFFNQRVGRQNQQQIKWAYQDGDNPVAFFFKGILIILVTLLGLGIFYAIVSLVVLALCILFTLLGETIMTSVYENMWNSGGEVKQAIDSSFAQPAMSTSPIHPIPTVFGNLINPIQASNSNGEVTPTILPIYLFYELFKYAGFDPSITQSSSSFGFGEKLTIMGSGFLRNIYTYDSIAGIGFVMLPWWLIILVLCFFIASELTKVFLRAIQRILVLVVYFLVIVIMAFYSLADGGKQWWRFILSAIKWFLFNSMYMIMLNIGCMLIFVFMLVGKIILDDTRSTLLGTYGSKDYNGNIIDGISKNLLGGGDIHNVGLTLLDTVWAIITKIATGFSYKLNIFSDLIMLVFLWLSVVGAKHIVFLKFDQGWFGKDDPAINFFQSAKKEMTTTMIYAAAAGAVGFGLFKASSGIAHATVGRFGNKFRVKVAKWGDKLKRNIRARRGGANKSSKLYAKINGKKKFIGRKVGNEAILNKRGTKNFNSIAGIDGKLKSDKIYTGKTRFTNKKADAEGSFLQLDKAQTFRSRTRSQYKYNLEQSRKNSLNFAVGNTLAKGGPIKKGLRDIFANNGVQLPAFQEMNFNEALRFAESQPGFRRADFFEALKTDFGNVKGSAGKFQLLNDWVQNPSDVMKFPNKASRFLSNHGINTNKQGMMFDGFANPRMNGNFTDNYAGRLEENMQKLNERRNRGFAEGLKWTAIGLGGAIAFSTLNSGSDAQSRATSGLRRFASPGMLFEMLGLSGFLGKGRHF